MHQSNHYRTLQVSSQASAAEIKQAYRQLVKQFHPDSQRDTANHEQIIRINAAYEVLGDRQLRQRYDRQLATPEYPAHRDRQQRTAQAQQTQRRRTSGKDFDQQLDYWQQRVYTPIARFLTLMINSLETELDSLAADPFDDDLMENFENYIADCRQYHQQAQQLFQQYPNPIKAAGVAANLYHCLCRISEGIEELYWFTTSYDDRHLHTGQELFRIAHALRLDAQRSLLIVSGRS